MAASLSFTSFLNELADSARRVDGVVGLVAFGSTAARERADEWSDHDFAWLTEPGFADQFRQDLTWLPHAEDIALSVVEHHGGVKVIYRNGHRLEFGLAEVQTYSTWAGAPAEVLVGGASVHAATATVVARRPEGAVDAEREVKLMLTQLHSGVGRARRGETLSGSGLVRGEAVSHFARAAAARLSPEAAGLDELDPRRRFDGAYPQLGKRLEEAVRHDIEAAARALVALAEEVLSPGWPQFPFEGVAAVRLTFGWS